MTDRASFPPGDAREDWAIIRALSAVLGKTLPYNSLSELRAALYKEHPHMAGIDDIFTGNAGAIGELAKAGGAASDGAFANAIDDFYLTNPVARASAVMAECSALARGRMQQAAE